MKKFSDYLNVSTDINESWTSKAARSSYESFFKCS